MLKYDHDFNSSIETSHTKILKHIEPSSYVLELGPATGYMTRHMKEQLGCRVVCVEYDPESAQIASQYSVRTIVGNLEEDHWYKELLDEKFDYIICADVLEHLKNPVEALKKATNLLAPKGTVLVSVPNIGHNAIIMDLVKGDFNYRDLGLLDNTHLKFFTRKSLLSMLDEAGLKPLLISATFASPEETEFQQNYGLVNNGFRTVLESNPDGHVYQFITVSKRKEELGNKETVYEIDNEELKHKLNFKFAQFFFPVDGQYSEEESLKYFIENERIVINTEIDSSLEGEIRFDPINFIGYVKFLNLDLVDEDGHSILWEKKLSVNESVTIIEDETEKILFCKDSDPQIYFALPKLSTGKKFFLNLEFIQSENVIDFLISELISKDEELTSKNEIILKKEKELRHLENKNLKLEDQVKELEFQLSTTLKQNTLLEESFQKKTAEFDGLLNEIRELEAKINEVTSSSSWTITRPLRFLGQVAKNPKRSLIQLGYFITRKKMHLKLRPIYQLEKSKETANWISNGNDPQFHIDKWLTGWVKVVFHIDYEMAGGGKARIYFDHGKGFNEKYSYDLGKQGLNYKYIYIDPEVKVIRLDPIECDGEFIVKEISMIKSSHVTVRLGEKFKAKTLKFNKGIRFLKYGLAKLNDWKQKRGRYPRLSEIKPLARKAYYEWASRQRQHQDQLQPPVGFSPAEPIDPYDTWLEVNHWNERKKVLLEEELDSLNVFPLFSIIMPVYNPPIAFLEKALESVVNQVYEKWELCIADDASTNPDVRRTLEKWSSLDNRIKVEYCAQNGNISKATNVAASLANGEFYVFMDNDDELAPDALGEIVKYINAQPETDVLYSDDDKIDANGNRFAPQFKPDWSPELLLSFMYLSHIVAIRAELFHKVGGTRVGFEGSQDYDLALRATEVARNVGHIPKILYHWRVLPGSTASSGDAKPESIEAGRKAVQEAFKRRGVEAQVFQPDWAKKAACGIFAASFPDNGPKVAIIIPTKNQYKVLKKCIDSLKTTTYQNYEVYVIDNDSNDPDTLSYLNTLEHHVLKISNPGGKFSFAYINNQAVKQVEADLIVFLNNDTEIISPNWLSQMVGYSQSRGVGAVGARLIFPDGRIQHAGITHGLYHGMVGPSFKLLPSWNNGYLSLANVTRNTIAVTAACMLTSRDLFLSIGGFDEENFAVAYNDVDYCYRLYNAGYRMVYCASAELRHYEGYTRGFVDNPREALAFRQKYGNWTDPYYNVNLSLLNERFEINSKVVVSKELKPIKTLMCAFNLNWEGAPYCQFELTVELRDLGVIDPVVYCPHDGPLRAAYEEQGIPVHIFDHPLIGVYGDKAYRQAIKEFSDRVAQWGIELIYGNTLQTFYVIEAAKHMDIPSIWNPRESEPWQTYFNHFDSEIASNALKCFDYPYKVIFVSDASREKFMPLNSRNNFITIRDGLESKNFLKRVSNYDQKKVRNSLGISDDDIVVLLLGTVCDRKGQQDLVMAIEKMNLDSARKCKFLIVGDRPSEYSSKLKEIRNRLHPSIKENVLVIPETSEAPKYYAIADIFTCTSRIESYPRVILEAMSSGLPIITTPVFGIVEQVQPNVNGLFYAPGEINELAQKLEFMVAHESERQRMGANGKVVFETINNYAGMAVAYGEEFKEAWMSYRSR
nr:glycosyltransferase [Cohnella zeiphila]